MHVSSRVLLGAFLLVVLGSCAQSTEPTPIPSPDTFDPAHLTFELGAPEVVFTPTGLAGAYSLPDSPFLAWRFTTTPSQQMTAYSAAGYTFRLVGPTLASLNRTAILPTPVLGPPPHTNPPPAAVPADWCGAWLQAAEQDGGVIRGWYHSERGCAYGNNFQTHKSVSYAQSTDGGATWTKPNHPDNVVIEGSNPPCAFPCGGPVYQTGAGDPSVIRVGDYYYMYFTDTDQRFSSGSPAWAEGLARSHVASGGVPHTWEKWCDNGWSSLPNCHAKPLANLGSANWSVSRSATLQQLFAVFVNSDPSSATGIRILSSADGMAWTAIPGALIAFPPPELKPNHPGEIYLYPSLVPEAGGTDWDQTAYLYYMYVYPREDYIYQRYLFRRRVDVRVHSSPVMTPQAVVPLQRRYSAFRQDHWVTTAPICMSGLAMPCHPDSTRYGDDQTSLLEGAKVYSSGGPGLVALHDCYDTLEDDHRISLDPQCEGPQQTRLRPLGWIWQSSRPGTVPLYRCHDTTAGDHFVSTRSDCEGATQEFRLGYAPVAAGS